MKKINFEHTANTPYFCIQWGKERRLTVLEKIKYLFGKPIGVSFKNGLAVSGVLCDANEEEICLMEYMYQEKFIQKQYDFKSIQGIYIFPSCTDKYIN